MKIKVDRTRELEITKWLTEHAGPYYGKGTIPVIKIGSGWEMLVEQRTGFDGPGFDLFVDITDGEIATMFALRWGTS